MTLVKRPSKTKLSLRRRQHGLSMRDAVNILKLEKCIEKVLTAIVKVPKRRKNRKLKRLLSKLVVYHQKISTIDSEILEAKLPPIVRKNITIDSFEDDEIRIYFRFETKAQLRELITGFQIPDLIHIERTRCTYTADEFLLTSLYRLHRPTTLSDPFFRDRIGLSYQHVSEVFNEFLKFMEEKWGYLLTDNMQFWLPYLPACAQAINNRCMECKWHCPFPPSTLVGGLRVFGFIDNTLNATCRPGGGPERDGANAPRNDPLIQQEFYSGWKKLHGIKWQTIDLPNGMNFHVFCVGSLRRNDLESLEESRVNEKLQNLQLGQELQWVVCGDSAYVFVSDSHILARHNNAHNTPREILENRALSSCRETIEWDYGNVGTMWSYVDYKKILKLRQMPVKKTYFVAMLLRNAHVTMNGCNTSKTYKLNPPTFQTWVRQGPR